MKRSLLIGISLLIFFANVSYAIRVQVSGTDIAVKGTWHDVRTYGAIGDGVTDDTAALQAAIDAATAGSRLVLIPEGTYLFSTRLTINCTDLQIRGVSRRVSVLKFAGTSTSAIYIEHAPGFVMKFLELNGADSTDCIGIETIRDDGNNKYGLSMANFENVKIIDFDSYLVKTQKGFNLSFKHCRFEGGNDHQFYHWGTTGIQIMFEQCWFNSIAANKYGYYPDDPKGAIEFDNTFFHGDGHGIYVSGGPFLINHCNFEELAIDSTATHGIALGASFGWVTVSNTLFYPNPGPNTSVKILGAGINATAGNLFWKNNRDSTAVGIDVNDKGAYSHNIAIFIEGEGVISNNSSPVPVYRLKKDAGGMSLEIDGTLSGTTLDTGQGANELYDMDQNVLTSSTPTFVALETGQGANELYDMDQNVLTSSTPTFGDTTINGVDPSIIFDGSTVTDTDFWLGLTADEEGDNDDIFQIGRGTVKGVNPKFTMLRTGYVGIGLPAPQRLFHVAGIARVGQVGGVTGKLELLSSNGVSWYIDTAGASSLNMNTTGPAGVDYSITGDNGVEIGLGHDAPDEQVVIGKGTKYDGYRITAPTEIQTTDATQTTIDSITLPDENTYHVEAFVIGVQSDGTDRASYHIAGTVYRTGGMPAVIQGAVTNIHAQESNGALDATFTVNASDVRCSVTGIAAETWEWGCTLKYMNMSN